jgi:large subunit ribosomal protein L7/L12
MLFLIKAFNSLFDFLPNRVFYFMEYMSMSTTTDELIEKLKTITLFEASELVAQIEATFGVDASAPVGGFVAAPGVGGGAAVEAAEEKTTFDVILEDVASDKRVPVLKIIRNLTSLDLKEAKESITSLPKTIQQGVSKEDAEAAKQQLEAAGAKVTIS